MATEEEKTAEQPDILDESAFCRQLGLEPSHVVSGSITLEFTSEGTMIGWRSKALVPARVAGLALLAGSGMEIRDEEKEPAELPQDSAPEQP